MKPALALLLVLACAAAGAQDLAQHGPLARCVSGNCQSGFGTLDRDGSQFTGPWLNGRFVDAIYEVRWAADPAKAHRMKVGSNGQFIEGTMLRGGARDFRKTTSTYTGTFASVFNPFTEQVVSDFRTGRYEDHKGRVFDGEFQYLPSRAAGDRATIGIYIFQGVRIDPVEDEVLPGLFVSDLAPGGLNIEFHRARPDYLAKLQADFAHDKSTSAREKADEARTQAFFKMLLGITVAGVNMMQGPGARSGSNSRMALDLLGQVLQGKQTPEVAVDTMGADMLKRIASQPVLQKDLELAGVSTSREAAQRVAQSLLAQPRRMTQQEYADLLRQAGR
jgi:hypothetical protein